METNKNTSAFTEWYDGLVGFHLTSERILDDLNDVVFGEVDPVRLRKWMIICWNNAIEAGQRGVEENQDARTGIHPWHSLEKLKEPLDTGSKI